MYQKKSGAKKCPDFFKKYKIHSCATGKFGVFLAWGRIFLAAQKSCKVVIVFNRMVLPCFAARAGIRIYPKLITGGNE